MREHGWVLAGNGVGVLQQVLSSLDGPLDVVKVLILMLGKGHFCNVSEGTRFFLVLLQLKRLLFVVRVPV